jgi:hypothetical protein
LGFKISAPRLVTVARQLRADAPAARAGRLELASVRACLVWEAYFQFLSPNVFAESLAEDLDCLARSNSSLARSSSYIIS